MVMDECHYATGNHNYATILKKYYHSLPENARPRILGLTASPLINVSWQTNEEQLQSLLTNFEKLMDARLVGFPTGSSSRSDVDQSVVEYTSDDRINLPKSNGWGLHNSREKEIKQLQSLLDDVGPRVTAAYASTLAREVSRNEFDQESPQQCENLKLYLLHVVIFLNQCIAEGKSGVDGHTSKMRKLECLLESVLADASRNQSPVGIVFVEMRIAAIALNNYFVLKNKRVLNSSANQDDDAFANVENDTRTDVRFDLSVQSTLDCKTGDTKVRSDVAVRKATHIFKYLSKKPRDEHQQQELEDDWLYQTTQIRSIISKLRHRQTNVLFATSIVEEVC